MHKYIIKLVLLFCLGNSVTSVANTELKVTYTFGNETSFRTIMEGFEKSTGIHVLVEYRRHEELKTNMMILMEQKKLPDAIIIPADHVGLYNLIHYSAIDPSIFKTSIPDRIWKSAMSDGVIYGVPLVQGNHLVLYYNKKLVKNVAKNWDDIFLQKKQFDAQGIATIEWDIEEPFYFLPFISAYGGWPIIDGKIQLDTQSVIDALNFYKELRIKNVYSKGCNHSCAIEKFKTNKLAYHINGEWEAPSFFAALGDDLGVSAIPNIGDKKMRPSFSTYVIAFPDDSLHQQKREALIKLVNYLQSTLVQQQIWTNTGAIPIESVAFEYVNKNAKGHLKDIFALLTNTEPLPADEAMSFIWDALGKGLIRFNLDLMDSKKTAIFMQELAERQMRNAKKKVSAITTPELP